MFSIPLFVLFLVSSEDNDTASVPPAAPACFFCCRCDHIIYNLILDLSDTLLVRADQGDVHTFLKDRIRPDSDALALETGLLCGEIQGVDGIRSAVCPERTVSTTSTWTIAACLNYDKVRGGSLHLCPF